MTAPPAGRPVSGFAVATLVLGITGIVLPAVICGILLGRWLLGKINQAVFEWLMIVFSLLGALRLIFS